jgi:tRNA uridine 5-carboxymethylaminomethyl modification enzyme
LGREEFVLGRDQAYIGVLIDDLVTKGTNEPYRMFTSRAEHRLVLREDNTIDRLGEVAIQAGLINPESIGSLRDLKDRRQTMIEKLRSERLFPVKETQEKLLSLGSSELLKPNTFEELLRRPEISCLNLQDFGFDMDLDPNVAEPVEIEVKYSGYVKRQLELIQQSKRLEELRLPEELSYKDIRGLSAEEVDKLSRIRPRTLGQAQRISGVNPSAIQAIMIYLKGHKKLKEVALVGESRNIN